MCRPQPASAGLLTGLLKIMPWVRQWRNDPDRAFGPVPRRVMALPRAPPAPNLFKFCSRPEESISKGAVMLHNKLDHGRLARRAAALTGTAALALTLTAAAPAIASSRPAPAHLQIRHSAYLPIELVAVTPGPGDVAGAGGVFNIDLAALARNGAGNKWLSAAKGYKPGIANPAPGIGHPDPFAPGLVVLLSTTPKKAGGPDANLAGVFQLTDVAKSGGLAQVIADWEVGKPGAFGKGSKTTLVAFLVAGTAPGILKGTVTPISNVVEETFTIGK
jgi:hypothetical protein